LAEAIPIIPDLYPFRFEGHCRGIKRSVLTGTGGVDKVAVQRAGGIEFFPADTQRSVCSSLDACFKLATGLIAHFGNTGGKQDALAEFMQPLVPPDAILRGEHVFAKPKMPAQCLGNV